MASFDYCLVEPESLLFCCFGSFWQFKFALLDRFGFGAPFSDYLLMELFIKAWFSNC